MLEPLKSEAMTTYKRIVNKGKIEGKVEEREEIVINAFTEGYKVEEIATFLKMPLDKVKSVIENFQKSQGQN
jgi:DNA-binding NarL/FixJ family response regulator